jgi:hypothetical protein
MASALALGLVAMSQQEAKAWCKWSVNAGISINYEGGNNNCLWGAFRGGQVPGYPTDVFQGGFNMPHANFGYPPAYPVFQDYGAYHGGQPQPAAPNGDQKPPQAKQPDTTTRAIYYPNQNYQSAGYYYPAAYYQQPAANYGYGFSQVPSYWYGN